MFYVKSVHHTHCSDMICSKLYDSNTLNYACVFRSVTFIPGFVMFIKLFMD